MYGPVPCAVRLPWNGHNVRSRETPRMAHRGLAAGTQARSAALCTMGSVRLSGPFGVWAG